MLSDCSAFRNVNCIDFPSDSFHRSPKFFFRGKLRDSTIQVAEFCGFQSVLRSVGVRVPALVEN